MRSLLLKDLSFLWKVRRDQEAVETFKGSAISGNEPSKYFCISLLLALNMASNDLVLILIFARCFIRKAGIKHNRSMAHMFSLIYIIQSTNEKSQRTWSGVLSADNAVKPTMSEK